MDRLFDWIERVGESTPFVISLLLWGVCLLGSMVYLIFADAFGWPKDWAAVTAGMCIIAALVVAFITVTLMLICVVGCVIEDKIDDFKAWRRGRAR